MEAKICEHGRQLSICAVCAPLADAAFKAIDPGNEPVKAKPHSLPWLLDFVRRHNGATISAGESMLFVNEIDRLKAELETSKEQLRMALFGSNMT